MADEFANLAVVIGIDAMMSGGRLETPVGDTQAIARLLESRFGYELILGCDGEATRESLRALLHEEFPRRVRKENRLLFYFAGHVAQDSAELEGPRGFPPRPSGREMDHPEPDRAAGDPFAVLHDALTSSGQPPGAADLRIPARPKPGSPSGRQTTSLRTCCSCSIKRGAGHPRSQQRHRGLWPLPEASIRVPTCLAALIRGRPRKTCDGAAAKNPPRSEVLPPVSDEFTTDLAVVLGIGDYDPAVGRLKTPVRDAEAVASLLESPLGYEVILRRDGEATLTRLRTLLHDELPQRVPAEVASCSISPDTAWPWTALSWRGLRATWFRETPLPEPTPTCRCASCTKPWRFCPAGISW